MGFSCLLLVFVVQQLFGQSSAYSLIHGEPTNYVSAVGDPGMTNPNVRVALEAWNFCNEVGFEVPNLGSPRWADCADLYCSSDSGTSSLSLFSYSTLLISQVVCWSFSCFISLSIKITTLHTNTEIWNTMSSNKILKLFL